MCFICGTLYITVLDIACCVRVKPCLHNPLAVYGFTHSPKLTEYRLVTRLCVSGIGWGLCKSSALFT